MNATLVTDPNHKIFILIDGSYFCFHRYYSLMNWWKNAFPEDPLENPIENERCIPYSYIFRPISIY